MFSFVRKLSRDVIESVLIHCIVCVPNSQPYVPYIFDRSVQSLGRKVYVRFNFVFKKSHVIEEALPAHWIEPRVGMHRLFELQELALCSFG